MRNESEAEHDFSPQAASSLSMTQKRMLKDSVSESAQIWEIPLIL